MMSGLVFKFSIRKHTLKKLGKKEIWFFSLLPYYNQKGFDILVVAAIVVSGFIK